MKDYTIDYCALQYLNQWLKIESYFCEGIESKKIEDQQDAIQKAAAAFKISRNLPKECDAGRIRLKPILNIINDLNKIDEKDSVKIILETERKISGIYNNRNVLSATTKILWIKFKSPVRIYDSQARKALKTKDGDYSAFNASFTKLYESKKSEIEMACQRLENVKNYCVNPNISSEELKKITSQDWFKERVIDIYLWNKGNV